MKSAKTLLFAWTVVALMVTWVLLAAYGRAAAPEAVPLEVMRELVTDLLMIGVLAHGLRLPLWKGNLTKGSEPAPATE